MRDPDDQTQNFSPSESIPPLGEAEVSGSGERDRGNVPNMPVMPPDSDSDSDLGLPPPIPVHNKPSFKLAVGSLGLSTVKQDGQ